VFWKNEQIIFRSSYSGVVTGVVGYYRKKSCTNEGKVADSGMHMSESGLAGFDYGPSRYEYKYIVNPSLLPSIRRFINSFARLDPFASRNSEGRYPICSLYLDTSDFRFYHQVKAGEKNRFKLRVRSYSDDSHNPVFLEVKRKNNSVIRKQRLPVPLEQAAMILNGSVGNHDLAEFRKSVFFVNQITLTSAQPVVRIRYLREAYESRWEEPVRLTIDTDVQYSPTSEPELSHSKGIWKRTPVQGAIIEIKFTERFPGWFSDLIRTFSLVQQPVPKYGLSVGALLGSGGKSSFLYDCLIESGKGV